MSTFYLKYRPQIIDELDLTKVRSQLKQALGAKTIPHAFLFSGSRGLGKTSAARIVAKALNCELDHAERPDNIEPCNHCAFCLSITKGNSSDVLEIDGASNRGIDDIRVLRETVSLAPIQLSNKIYIIDEVHMLTKEAFNALLKTLEEPPEHVYFILATTEPHKLPETIISRCLHIQFNRASKEEIIRSLQRVVIGESLEVEDQVFEAIINKTRGGFRDSVKLLEQLAFGGKKITIDKFNQLFVQTDVASFIQFLLSNDGVGALSWIAKQEELGADWTEVFRNILEYLRSILINLVQGNIDNIKLDKDKVIELIKLFIQAAAMQKSTLIETLPIELLIAQWIKNSSSSNIHISNKDENRDGLQPNLDQINTKSKTNDNNPSENHEKKDKHDTNIPDTKKSKKKIPMLTLAELKSKWEMFLDAIKPQNRSLETILRQSGLSQFDGDILTISVYYGLHKQQLESDKYLRIFENTFADIFGIKPRLSYVLGDKKEKDVVDAMKDQELEKNVEEIFN